MLEPDPAGRRVFAGRRRQGEDRRSPVGGLPLGRRGQEQGPNGLSVAVGAGFEAGDRSARAGRQLEGVDVARMCGEGLATHVERVIGTSDLEQGLRQVDAKGVVIGSGPETLGTPRRPAQPPIASSADLSSV